MRYFEEKKQIENIIFSKVSIFVLLILIFFVAKGVLGAYGDVKLTEENKSIAEQQLQELQKRNNQISKEVLSLKTEEGKEKEIRDKFRVAKEGERMIMIIDEKKPNYLNDKEDKTFWVKIKEFFGF